MNDRFLYIHRLASKLQTVSDIVKSELGDSLSAIGADFYQLRLMMFLASGVESTPTALANQLRVDPAVVTRLLGRLDAKKLIQRSPSSKDRRVIKVQLTANGEEQLTALFHAAGPVLEARFSKLSHNDADQLMQLLSAILED
ncbi:MarR family transcriptional regulator [Caballeronia sp. LZ043]|uniref:MarR family winged helix-turn-helix transcriptional regulator n=1 Tax=Caballeronia sp. LZ043 TaxID=3038569 RepID=UPI002865D63A|nr:MarR family transcriptional regulator [Caballeronia sp. LZ043]MDR5826114.1 MarR family transcriptional regulator [Caballeronia sp. LZ043]